MVQPAGHLMVLQKPARPRDQRDGSAARSSGPGARAPCGPPAEPRRTAGGSTYLYLSSFKKWRFSFLNKGFRLDRLHKAVQEACTACVASSVWPPPLVRYARCVAAAPLRLRGVPLAHSRVARRFHQFLCPGPICARNVRRLVRDCARPRLCAGQVCLDEPHIRELQCIGLLPAALLRL